MNKILRFEFDKLFRQRSFYICTIITAALLLISALSNNALAKASEDLEITGWKFAAEATSNAQLSLILGIFKAAAEATRHEHHSSRVQLRTLFCKVTGYTLVYEVLLYDR